MSATVEWAWHAGSEPKNPVISLEIGGQMSYGAKARRVERGASERARAN